MDGFRDRTATLADVPEIRSLMDIAIADHFREILAPEQIELSRSIMGLDTRLIEDGTYVLVEEAGTGRLAGCGGWSRRVTLFGGDHTVAQRNDRLLDPAVEPARIRAMYTHPAFARRGIGRWILSWCEGQARSAGFNKVELMATPSGKPLYGACGFRVIEEIVAARSGELTVPGWRMEKALLTAQGSD